MMTAMTDSEFFRNQVWSWVKAGAGWNGCYAAECGDLPQEHDDFIESQWVRGSGPDLLRATVQTIVDDLYVAMGAAAFCPRIDGERNGILPHGWNAAADAILAEKLVRSQLLRKR